jgi:hypothetical protein
MRLKGLIAVSVLCALLTACASDERKYEDGGNGEQAGTAVCCISCDNSNCEACSRGDIATCSDELRVCEERAGEEECETHNCWKGCRKPNQSLRESPTPDFLGGGLMNAIGF